MTADDFNSAGVGKLPGYLGVHVLSLQKREVRAELPVRPELMAPNGYLHAGSLVTLADNLLWVRLPRQPSRRRERLYDDRAESQSSRHRR